LKASIDGYEKKIEEAGNEMGELPKKYRNSLDEMMAFYKWAAIGSVGVFFLILIVFLWITVASNSSLGNRIEQLEERITAAGMQNSANFLMTKKMWDEYFKKTGKSKKPAKKKLVKKKPAKKKK